MIKHSEDKIQADCFKWLWMNYPQTRRLYFSIPLGGLRTPQGAAVLMATGAVKGTPDTCLAVAANGFNALYIEFKTDTGKLSPEQVKSHEALKKAGNAVVIVRSMQEFQGIVIPYLQASGILNL